MFYLIMSIILLLAILGGIVLSLKLDKKISD